MRKAGVWAIADLVEVCRGADAGDTVEDDTDEEEGRDAETAVRAFPSRPDLYLRDRMCFPMATPRNSSCE